MLSKGGGDRGMIFNGIEKEYITPTIGRIRPFFAPLIREGKFDNQLVKTDRGHRIIEVPIYITYGNLEEFRTLTEDIADWLVHDEPKPLIFKDDPDRMYFALVDDTMEEESVYQKGATTTIKIICGYKYSLEKTLEASGTHNIKGHKSTFWKSHTTFTSSASKYILEFNTIGTKELRSINRLEINFDFVSGDELDIDFLKRKITVNGNDISNTLSIINSNYMELPIGDVRFNASEETVITYRERYY